MNQFKAQQYRILIKETKQHLNKMLAHRATANQVTLGFLDALEYKYELELKDLRRKLSFCTPNKKQSPDRISDQDIERAKLVPISAYIKVPASKKVLCLFHTDKVPSMHVYGTTYHCFSCGAHGSVIDIVMKLYGLKFIDAIKRLI